jgi:hypothetical protein
VKTKSSLVPVVSTDLATIALKGDQFGSPVITPALLSSIVLMTVVDRRELALGRAIEPLPTR